MRLVCLDLEGVLIPEMWIMVAEHTGVPELRLTTRDIDDYDELMTHRLRVLSANGISLQDIQAVISTLEPIDGGREFLDALRERYQAVILSDTFAEFAAPAMRRLNQPFLLCNELVTDSQGMIVDYRMRQHEGKREAVKAFKSLNLEVLAVGDSFNDIAMLRAADAGYLFRPSETVRNAYPDLPRFDSHEELLRAITETRRVAT
ncbi:MAG: bifunctional phosphoserine phosphatase/homoserine phosphotransferase ThrH [Spirochaetales bacterium]|nr:MAG: bifunctional phosphoserine phosphatase/homoserine phosphotransferase ThrH [Spirochaetales bacterium]